jgi:hypothetical protein
MARHLDGKRAVVSDSGEYNGADIAALFREEEAHVIGDKRDLTRPGTAEDLIREAGHVDILIANSTRPYEFVPALAGGRRDKGEPKRRRTYIVPVRRHTNPLLAFSRIGSTA